MTPELLYNTGIILCGAAVAVAVVAAVVLGLVRARLNKRLDAEFGKRRR